MKENNIFIKGARVNNLKNIDLDLPRGKFIVITGLSGSGKSSLAFDTLYAEGRRRYVESLSAYARQFLGKMTKPECDFIRGLPPAVAIEQKVNTRNPRSTVGTSTEIYDYLRLLYARVGKTISPISGAVVKKHTIEDVVNSALTYGDGTRVAVAAPIILPEGRDMATQLDILEKEGFTRIVVDDSFIDISDAKSDKRLKKKKSVDLLIDRLAVSTERDEQSRLAESAEAAFNESGGRCVLLVFNGNKKPTRLEFSTKFEADGLTFPEPTDQMFNFNNPYGACPVCEGFGKALGIDEGLVVPDPTLSVYDDAVAPWRGPTMSEWKREFVKRADALGFPIHRPYYKLTDKEKDILWRGAGDWSGIDGFFEWVDSQRHKVQYRVMYARYRAKTICPACHGARLKPEALNIKIDGYTIADLVRMPVGRLKEWADKITFEGNDAKASARLMTEIRNRLSYLVEVGLGYLTLDRLSNSLSGGESQRINLATSLGSSLVGSLYILDEPSIGLHPRDTARLIGVLRKLQALGNTVVVVEHDEEIMRAADIIVDVGPDAGRLGGEIVYVGAPSVDAGDTSDSTRSYTLRYLRGELKIDVPKKRRKWRDSIEITHATENNLKDISVKFPLGVMTVVTGVSGSGKSTLVGNILYRSLGRKLGVQNEKPGQFGELRGDLSRISDIVFVDQNPIGKSSRSNPATYLKAYDEIRELFSRQPLSRQLGLTPAFFSFNTDGGRCDECKGEGFITIPMQFLADVTVPCESCRGRRFKKEILDVKYRGLAIDEVLDMTIDQAIEFFAEADDTIERRIIKRLQPLHDVGLGYIKLGQSSSTLSGGENQRVKLASFLADERPNPTMFIFDEPTTGLHFHDISVLLDSFNRLIEKGHTLIIIEHNIDMIKCADHIIDLGPEGGEGGGEVVAAGTPEQVAKSEASYTAKYLREVL